MRQCGLAVNGSTQTSCASQFKLSLPGRLSLFCQTRRKPSNPAFSCSYEPKIEKVAKPPPYVALLYMGDPRTLCYFYYTRTHTCATLDLLSNQNIPTAFWRSWLFLSFWIGTRLALAFA